MQQYRRSAGDARTPGTRRVAARLRHLLMVPVLALPFPVTAAEGSGDDMRTRIVESTLKDLSADNDAGIQGRGIRPVPGKDAMGDPRVDLVVKPPLDPQRAVAGEVQSSLHKLRRETVSSRTADGRKARVDESLDRAARTEPSDPRR